VSASTAAPGGRIAAAAVLLGLLLAVPGRAAAQDTAADPAAVERGRQVFLAASCASCHTADETKRLAGGRALKTPFGTFYTPNITPDPQHGIGRWSFGDFRRALREGIAPDGSPFYPAFPYTSYAGMADQDVAALWAYLRSQPAHAVANRPHALDFPYDLRPLLWPWRWLFFDPAPPPAAAPAGGADPVERGRYLVHALGHCGECHTPRNLFGAMEEDSFLAGNASGPEGSEVPDITPAGIGEWSAKDIAYYLESGFTPEFDAAGGPMAEVIQESTSQLPPEDRQAIAAYLKTLPARP